MHRMLQKVLSTISLAVYLVWISSFAFATQTQQKIKTIDVKIAKIKASISHDKNKRNVYLKQLKTTEKAASASQLELHETNLALKRQQFSLNRLNKNSEEYQKKILEQQKWIASQIRAAYLLGQQPSLKLILNQGDASRINRLMMYYRYLTQDRIHHIETFKTLLNDLQNAQEKIHIDAAKLTDLQQKQQKTQMTLTQLKQHREEIITSLNHEINHKNQKLSDLIANKRLLEQTLHHLEKNTSPELENQQDFLRLRGTLLWPTSGHILPLFGTEIYQSELKWDGILIRTTENKPVHAIAPGVVVFSKWLPGYGLLLIINHGHGYMTLYGRNHSVYKKPGDKVLQGDLIATVGKSGGYSFPALYFAIRYNSKPLNPMAWCH